MQHNFCTCVNSWVALVLLCEVHPTKVVKQHIDDSDNGLKL